MSPPMPWTVLQPTTQKIATAKTITRRIFLTIFSGPLLCWTSIQDTNPGYSQKTAERTALRMRTRANTTGLVGHIEPDRPKRQNSNAEDRTIYCFGSSAHFSSILAQFSQSQRDAAASPYDSVLAASPPRPKRPIIQIVTLSVLPASQSKRFTRSHLRMLERERFS